MPLFEAIGRTFFYRSHPKIFFFLLMLPLFTTTLLLVPRFWKLRAIEQEFDSAALVGKSALAKRGKKDRFFKRYSDFEPYFVNQSLETFSFLQDELEGLQQLQKHPAIRNKAEIARRIAFLKGTENQLAFAEETVQSSSVLKESEERQLHPVEINEEDLNRLLSLIEGVTIGHFSPHPRSPQLIIQDFSLIKKEGTNTYDLNLSLIKREFQHETKP